MKDNAGLIFCPVTDKTWFFNRPVTNTILFNNRPVIFKKWFYHDEFGSVLNLYLPVSALATQKDTMKNVK